MTLTFTLHYYSPTCFAAFYCHHQGTTLEYKQHTNSYTKCIILWPQGTLRKLTVTSGGCRCAVCATVRVPVWHTDGGGGRRQRKTSVSSDTWQSTVGSSLATVRLTTIHFYDPCPVGPSTPDLWHITVATQASFLYLVRFQLISGVHVFIFLF